MRWAEGRIYSKQHNARRRRWESSKKQVTLALLESSWVQIISLYTRFMMFTLTKLRNIHITHVQTSNSNSTEQLWNMMPCASGERFAQFQLMSSCDGEWWNSKFKSKYTKTYLFTRSSNHPYHTTYLTYALSQYWGLNGKAPEEQHTTPFQASNEKQRNSRGGEKVHDWKRWKEKEKEKERRKKVKEKEKEKEESAQSWELKSFGWCTT